MSPSTGRRYPLTMVCEVYGVARSTVNARLRRMREASITPAQKRGPKTQWSDEEVLEAIREVLEESPFLSEGHRKVTARLRRRGMRVGKNRVLRLVRENGLLAPGAAEASPW